MPPRRKSNPDAVFGSAAEMTAMLRQLQADEEEETRLNSGLARVQALKEEIHRRQMDFFKLYNPFQVDFHKSDNKARLVIGSNRSGKTVAAAAEMAWILRGEHPYHPETRIPRKNGNAAIVALKHEQIGEVIYKKLFRSGAFDIIHDDRDGIDSWRPVVADQPYDIANRHRWTPAPPMLIEGVHTSDIAYHDAKRKQFTFIQMRNGWTCSAHSSEGSPSTGDERHAVWFDEEILNPEFYSETANRATAKHRGLFWWSTCPQARTQRLHELYLMSIDPKKWHLAKQFRFSIWNNTGMDQQAKQEFVDMCPAHERKWRIDGEFALQTMVVYPEFSEDKHVIKGHVIPADWTHYVFIDPGYQVCAVLFIAIPPPGNPNSHEVHFWRELYIEHCSPRLFAEALRDASQGINIEGMYVDGRGARQHSQGGQTGDGTIGEQYSRELERAGVSCFRTGHKFADGCDEVSVRENSFRAMMHEAPDHSPRCRIHSSCKQLTNEIRRQYYKTEKKGQDTLVTNRRDREDHLIWGLEAASRAVETGQVKWEEPHASRAKRDGLDRIKRFIAARGEDSNQRADSDKRAAWLGPASSLVKG